MKKIKIVKHKNIKWYKVFEPEVKELSYFREKYKFHPLDIEDCLERVQRPKIDTYKKYLFFVLHLPRWYRASMKIETAELKVFVGPDYLITISNSRTPILDKLFYQAKKSYKKRARFFKDSPYHLFYFILNQLLININPITKELGQIINNIDEQLLQGNYKNGLQEISAMRRNLILFQTIIKPQIPIFRKLEQGKAGIIDPAYAYYWGNLVDRLRSIWEQVEDYLQLVEGLATTNESLLSYKTNEVIKILTIFSVVLLPLTLISGIYGMNINTLPFLSSSFSFLIISGIMVGIVVIMLGFFKFKKWV